MKYVSGESFSYSMPSSWVDEDTYIPARTSHLVHWLAKYSSVVMSYANLSPDWQDSVDTAAREAETKAGADAALTMTAYFPPCTWEHQWTWPLFSSRNLGVSLILNSSSCDHIISLGDDPALCPLTMESSKPKTVSSWFTNQRSLLPTTSLQPKLFALIVHLKKEWKGGKTAIQAQS